MRDPACRLGFGGFGLEISDELFGCPDLRQEERPGQKTRETPAGFLPAGLPRPAFWFIEQVIRFSEVPPGAAWLDHTAGPFGLKTEFRDLLRQQLTAIGAEKFHRSPDRVVVQAAVEAVEVTDVYRRILAEMVDREIHHIGRVGHRRESAVQVAGVRAAVVASLVTAVFRRAVVCLVTAVVLRGAFVSVIVGVFVSMTLVAVVTIALGVVLIAVIAMTFMLAMAFVVGILVAMTFMLAMIFVVGILIAVTFMRLIAAVLLVVLVPGVLLSALALITTVLVVGVLWPVLVMTMLRRVTFVVTLLR